MKQINELKEKSNDIGNWMKDNNELPCFKYTGKVPYLAYLPDGRKVKLPEDPWFLLGNYQLTLFTHVSGEYELITGQRSWGRVNQGAKPNSGENRSVLEMFENGSIKESIPLTGMNSLAADPSRCSRIFGCGFAEYSYTIGNGLTVTRNLSVKPSFSPSDGTSAFLLTVTICNGSESEKDFVYTEGVTANYREIQYQYQSIESNKVQYANTAFYDMENNLVGVKINGTAKDPLLFTTRESMSKYEGFPPSLFLQSVTGDGVLSDSNNEIAAKYTYSLQPGEKAQFSMIIGYCFDNDDGSAIPDIKNQLVPAGCKVSLEGTSVSVYAREWRKVLPAFDNEEDDKLRQEMIWHAYNLEAMSTYSEYYKETKIPQGTIYDYDWGAHASARDNFQHALPLVYYNPQHAKSVLRYMLKRTTPFGEIRLVEIGNGYAGNERYFTSDQQLFFFLLLSEYLRVTKDYVFLTEEVEHFPVTGGVKATVLKFVEKCFVFLRDEIGTGAHGLVRLLNSDWNDAVYYIVKVPYNTVLFTGESHMNSAMAISILQNLIPELRNAGKKLHNKSFSNEVELISTSMSLYRFSILDAFIKDMGNRTFPRRMYFNGKAYGDDNMFLEPQGYTLLIDEFSDEKKRVLYNEMLNRIYSGEKLGAREQQVPEFEDEHFDKGSRENGGFWWALNGPVIMGVSQFDKAEAMHLLRNMTFDNYSKAFPSYWSSYWSAADNIESSLIPEEGLPDQSEAYANIPVFCAHPHAWILYCYYMIKSK
jgi:cellobiose phosphorylase